LKRSPHEPTEPTTGKSHALFIDLCAIELNAAVAPTPPCSLTIGLLGIAWAIAYSNASILGAPLLGIVGLILHTDRQGTPTSQ
jgi:hypothetical protein